MSAIAGIYHLDGRTLDPAEVGPMLTSMAHRGPTGSGLWSRGPVGLGHRMLRTTPELLHEKLSIVSETGALAITADARVDNHDELIAALNLDDSAASEITDSALILRAYEKWGVSCPDKLLGDFAFVIWDERAKTLFCARDHFGVKPFYYHHSPRIFVCASEIKALLTVPDVPRRLNETRVADYLVPMFEDQAITFYRDIVRLPPGHCITVRPGGLSLRRYWALDPSRELCLASPTAYLDQFRDLFTDAVRRRLRCAVPVGSLLSGGLDSSSIVCIARELLMKARSDPLCTFSAVFDSVPDSNERAYIDAVLAQNSVIPTSIEADQISPLADLEQVFRHQDEAFWNPQMVIHWSLFRAARSQGVGVILDGFVGDSVTSYGLSYLAELARSARWIDLSRHIAAVSRRLQSSPAKIIRRHVFNPLIPVAAREAWERLRGRNGIPPAVNEIFARRIGLAERIRHESLNGERFGHVTSARRHHWLDLTSGVYAFALEVLDKAAAAFGIEPRYPFLDKRLVEFCLAVPSGEKLRDGWPRSILRRSLEGILPPQVAWRVTKGNLGFNFARGLRFFERDRLDNLILRPGTIIKRHDRYLNVDALRTTYKRYLITNGQDDALEVWKAATLALWLDRTNLST